jgi:hypothetical protein
MSVSYYRKRLSDKDFYLSQARRPLRSDAFSPYRGVTKGTPTHPYRVALTYKGVRHPIGLFTDELEAARAYNEAALRIIGDYAVLNELPPSQS